jgi:Trypsin-like peptidase domain
VTPTRTLTALAIVLLLCSPPARADGLSKAEVAKLGKAATAFVEVKPINASGSAFCVHPSGLFITNHHVVADGKEFNLVLNAGQKDQRVLKAKVLRSDPKLDLALMSVEGEKDLPALPLGSDEKLSELTDLVACGFPFGTRLSLEKGEYPAISVNFGSVTALRKKDGKLEAIQVDVELNPGNSGGPVLDLDGKVVGVVVAGIRTTKVNFAIPVSHLAHFVETPELRFDAPTLSRADAGKAIEFQVKAVDLVPADKPLEVEMLLKSGKDAETRHKMELADGAFRLKTVVIPKPDGAAPLHVALTFPEGVVSGIAEDRSFKVGDREVKLSEVRSFRTQDQLQVLLRDGSTLTGPVSGLNAVPVQLGGDKLTLNLAKVREAQVSPAGELPGVTCTVVASRNGKEVARVTRVLLNEGTPK